MTPMFCKTPTNPQTNPSDPAIRTVTIADRKIDDFEVFAVASVADCNGATSACTS
jgi:hypothetical protein